MFSGVADFKPLHTKTLISKDMYPFAHHSRIMVHPELGIYILNFKEF